MKRLYPGRQVAELRAPSKRELEVMARQVMGPTARVKIGSTWATVSGWDPEKDQEVVVLVDVQDAIRKALVERLKGLRK